MSFIKSRTIQLIIVCVVALAMIAQGAFVIKDTAYGADENSTDNLGYVDNQLMVTFKQDVSHKEAVDIVAFAVSEELLKNNAGAAASISKIKEGITLKKIKSDDNMMLVKIGTNLDEETISKELERNPDVDKAQPNYRYKAAADTDFAKATAQQTSEQQAQQTEWYMDYIDAPEALKVIEEQKNKKQQTQENQAGTESSEESNPVTIAIIGGKYEGALINNVVGKGNDIIATMPVEAEATTAGITSGIDYACSHNARIIILSVGRGGYDAALEKKINWALEEGALIIAPAGDEGIDAAWYPADYKNCIGCVNTVKYSDAYSMACRNEKSNYGKDKDISAPGTDIRITDENGEEVTGTSSSCSAAIVAATAAMVMHTDTKLKPAEVRETLVKTATDISVSDFDVYTGYGNVNAYEAVALATGVKTSAEEKTLGKTVAKAKAEKEGIAISWSSVKDASNYIVFRKGPEDDYYMQIADLNEDEMKWSDTGCAVGKEYSYKVMAAATSEDGKKIKGEGSDPMTVKFGE